LTASRDVRITQTGDIERDEPGQRIPSPDRLRDETVKVMRELEPAGPVRPRYACDVLIDAVAGDRRDRAGDVRGREEFDGRERILDAHPALGSPRTWPVSQAGKSR